MNDQTKPRREPFASKLAALASLAEIDVSALKAHPIADEDPLMNDAEFEALKADLKFDGMREPITLFSDPAHNGGAPSILDGRNRHNGGKAIGYPWRAENFRVFTGSVEEARRFAASLNDIRRHLGMDKRKEKAAKLIAANPGLSSRELAVKCGVSHTLIAEMRREKDDERKKDEREPQRAWVLQGE